MNAGNNLNVPAGLAPWPVDGSNGPPGGVHWPPESLYSIRHELSDIPEINGITNEEEHLENAG